MLFWQIILNKWFILALSGVIAFFGLGYTYPVVRVFGKMGWAERRFGEGGTYTVWKIIGVAAPFLAIIYFFSGLDARIG